MNMKNTALFRLMDRRADGKRAGRGSDGAARVDRPRIFDYARSRTLEDAMTDPNETDISQQRPSGAPFSPEQTLRLVDTAVEKLRIRTYLDETPDVDSNLRGKIRGSYERCRGLNDGAVMFYMDGIALASSPAQFSVGSAEFDEAMHWALEMRNNVPPVAFVATLLLVYLVRRYVEQAVGGEEERVWREIDEFLASILDVRLRTDQGDRR
jgi:hypothetical protein